MTDALGSTIALGSSTGTIPTTYTYDPFGVPTLAGTASTNRTQFTGREWDSTWLQYSCARYYNPTVGRFISEDPIGLAGGDVNLYAYVGNSPLNATDPSGLIFGGRSLNPVRWNWSAGMEGGVVYTDTVTDFLPYTGTIKAGARLSWNLATGNRDSIGADVAGLIPFRIGKAFRFGKVFRFGREINEAERATRSLGSTGRSAARNLKEKLAVEQARSNPAAGTRLPLTMSDPRWPASEGRVKMSQRINGIEVHYVRNTRTGAADDFKFIDGTP